MISAITGLKDLQGLDMRVGLKPGPIFTALGPRITRLSIQLITPGSGGPASGDDASLQHLSRLTTLRELTVYGSEADMARASSASLVIDRARLGRILSGRLPPHLTRRTLRLCTILRPPPPPEARRAAPVTRHSLAFSLAAGKLTAVELPPAPSAGGAAVGGPVPAPDPGALPALELAELATLCKVLIDSPALGPRLPRLHLGCRLEAQGPRLDDATQQAVRALARLCDTVRPESLAAQHGTWDPTWDPVGLMQLLGCWPRYLYLSSGVPPLVLGDMHEALQLDAPAALGGRRGFASLRGPGDLLAMATRRLSVAGEAAGWPHAPGAGNGHRRAVLLLRGPDLMIMARDAGWRPAGSGLSWDEEARALSRYSARLAGWLQAQEGELSYACDRARLPLPEAGGVKLSSRLGAVRSLGYAAARGDPCAAEPGSAARVVPTVLAAGDWTGAPEIQPLLEAAAAEVLQAVWDGVEEGSGLCWGRAERLRWIVDTWVARRARFLVF